ncbi:hypothetical protein cyc_08101 [Cyclospora cayetanensis]|uniref:Kinesin-like protein n=1 Tax=Cyclospora cayetanensis TaxID=88456 RepID=A0A1D3CRK9_9EIME|nr:hypothetical protein cyc_08101 [Cyclospora cayetanensis]
MSDSKYTRSPNLPSQTQGLGRDLSSRAANQQGIETAASVPVKRVTTTIFAAPRLSPTYIDVPIPIYVPRYVEVPVPVAKLDPQIMRQESRGVECAWSVSSNKKELLLKEKEDSEASRLRRLPSLSFSGCFGCEDDTGTVYEDAALPLHHSALPLIQELTAVYLPTGKRGVGNPTAFSGIQKKRGSSCGPCEHYDVRISLVEVYLEKVFDLLRTTENEDDHRMPQLRTHCKSSRHFTPLPSFDGSNPADYSASGNLSCLICKSTLAGAYSHVVVFARLVASSTLWCTGRLKRIEVGSSSLTLVDLAGSERMTRCPARRLRQPEGAADLHAKKLRCAESTGINKSLFFLSLCFESLVKQEERRRAGGTAQAPGAGSRVTDIPIPYRYSNLTRILARSLQSDARIVLLVTLNPSYSATQLSLHAIEFAQRASCLRERQPRKGEANRKQFLLKQHELLRQLKRTTESFTVTQWPSADSGSPVELQKAAQQLQQEIYHQLERLSAILSRRTGMRPSWGGGNGLSDGFYSQRSSGMRAGEGSNALREQQTGKEAATAPLLQRVLSTYQEPSGGGQASQFPGDASTTQASSCCCALPAPNRRRLPSCSRGSVCWPLPRRVLGNRAKGQPGLACNEEGPSISTQQQHTLSQCDTMPSMCSKEGTNDGTARAGSTESRVAPAAQQQACTIPVADLSWGSGVSQAFQENPSYPPTPGCAPPSVCLSSQLPNKTSGESLWERLLTFKEAQGHSRRLTTWRSKRLCSSRQHTDCLCSSSSIDTTCSMIQAATRSLVHSLRIRHVERGGRSNKCSRLHGSRVGSLADPPDSQKSSLRGS